MSNDLLHYYERELAWLRQAGGDFAQAHPQIASNLRLSADIIEDPHVSRLIESVAFLNARIQSKLDDDFPEITDALLNHLYPHYLAPLPAISIVELIAADGLDKAEPIPAGTLIETAPVDGTACHFRTTYPVTLLPYKLGSAQMLPRPFVAPGSETVRGANAIIALRLDTDITDFSFAAADVDYLRLHLRVQPQYAWTLYELLANHCLQIVVANGELDPRPVFLNGEHLQVVGFNEDEALLPYPGSTQPAYRLLTEFFHFPDKFLFLNLTGLKAATREKAGSLFIYIYLRNSNRELERNLNAEFFSLAATPAVNIFSQPAEPMSIQPGQVEYLVVPESRAIDAYEVYAISRVEQVFEKTGERRVLPAYFGMNHSSHGQVFWHSSRRLVRGGPNHNEAGFDTHIAITDIACDTVDGQDSLLQVETLCTNRNLPGKLPYGAGQPKFQLSEGAGRLQEIRSLTPPTPVVRPNLGDGARWRLLSHLNLNYLSLTGHPQPAEPLREMLRLYDFSDSASTRALIQAIDSMQCEVATAPIRSGGRASMCRGIDITLTFDEPMLAGSSPLLYAHVLEHFFAQYVTLNSFIRLTAKLKGKDGVLKRWPPRAGAKPLL